MLCESFLRIKQNITLPVFCFFPDARLEGWLSLPSKNTKRFGWERKVTAVTHKAIIALGLSLRWDLMRWVPDVGGGNTNSLCLSVALKYVVMSSRKILFYNSEVDREQSNPFLILDIE